MKTVANTSDVDALNLSNDATFRVPLSHKMLHGPKDDNLTLLNNGAKLGEGGGSV